MANVVRILITAKDEISSDLDRIRDKAATLSKTDIGKGLLQGAGIAAFGLVKDAAMGALQGVADFAAGSVKAARDEEVGIARLGAALKSNVKDWDGNTAAIEDHINALVRTSGFSDGEMRDSLSRLVAATHDVNKAYALQATAMDLARFKGISLVDASIALTKVEGGQYRALKELGIVLKEGATQTEALAAVQKVAGGQAAAYMDTLAGKTDVLNNRMEDLQETLGGKVTPAFITATETALGFMDALDPSAPVELEDRLKGVADVLNIVNPLMWSTNITAGLMGDAQAKAADQAAAAAAVGAEAWDTGSERIGAAFDTIGGSADDAGDSVKSFAKKSVYWASWTQSELERIGSDSADALFDPIIEKSELARLKRERDEQRNIATSKSSTKAQVRDAKDRIEELDKAIFEQQVKLIGMGKLNKKEQAEFLADLKSKWKTSTGDAKVYIGQLIAAIEQIPNSKTVSITVKEHFVGTGNDPGHAAGGPVAPYSSGPINERVPETLTLGAIGGRVWPNGAGGGGGGGDTFVFNISTPAFTPGAAQAFADQVGPVLSRWQQSRGLIAR